MTAKILFVCWGNICRSPMAEQVARAAAAEQGVAADFDSAGTSTEELGNPIDPRAARTLRDHGYQPGDHVAHQVDRGEIEDADLVVAMEDVHLRRMESMTGGSLPATVRLLSDFDPAAEPGSGVPDPWYGGQDGFEDTLAAIEAAMPGLLEHIRGLETDPRLGSLGEVSGGRCAG